MTMVVTAPQQHSETESKIGLCQQYLKIWKKREI